MDETEKPKADRKKYLLWFLEAAAVAVALYLFIFAAGQGLRRIAIAQLGELTNTRIKIGRIDINLDGSVYIERLSIRPNTDQQYDNTILRAERVYARFGVGSVLLFHPRLKEIKVNGFIFNAQHDLDENMWNLASLKINTHPGGSGKMPLIQLGNGILKYTKISNRQSKTVAAIPIEAEFALAQDNPRSYMFEVITARRPGLNKSKLHGQWQPGKITFAGGLTSADIPTFERVWNANILAAEFNYDAENNYTLKLKTSGLQFTHQHTEADRLFDRPAFMEKIAPFKTSQKFFSRYRPQGCVDISIKSRGNLDNLAQSTIAGSLYCRGVGICDRKFPYPLKDITGRINFTEKSLSLNNLIGRHGDVEVKLNGWSTDYGSNRKYNIQITSSNMALDKDLYNALSDRRKKVWDSFCPDGTAAIDYQRSRTPQAGRQRSIIAELIDVNAAYKNFPYPLQNLTGKIRFEPESVTISNLTSRTSLSKIVLDGKVTRTNTKRPIYDITVAAENIPLDSTLAAALPEGQQQSFSQLNMTGLADAHVNIFTPEQTRQPTSFVCDIDLKQTSLRLEQFPLPVSEITAGITYRPGSLQIEDFKGLCQDGAITVTGRIWPGQKDQQTGYCLSVDANAMNLSEDFINTMPAHVKNVLCKIQPKGKINLAADLNKYTPDRCADFKVVVDCLGNSVNSEIFPYSFKDITGRLTLTADDITFHDLQAAVSKADAAQPGIPQVKINGKIQLRKNAFENGQFDLSARDIIFDEKLTLLLNEAVRPFYQKFAPTGRFDLHCQDIKLSQTIDGEKYIDFTAVLELKNCSLKTSPEITDLNLSLQTNCQYKTGYGFCSDYNVLLKAESLRIMGKALTDFNAAVSYDQKQHSFSSKNFIADCYDGRVTGKFQLTQAGPDAFKYSLQSGFCGIDLKQFLSDGAENTKSANSHSKTTGYTTGSMDGSFSLVGVFADEATRIGQCRLAIHNMQVGKLSPIAKLLTALELTESADYAFDRMLLDSYIKEDKMFLRELDLAGQSVAFNGSGSLDLNDNNIDLDLTARSRRQACEEPSLWQSFTEGLGTAVVKMEVDGSIYDPHVKTTALPVIKATLGLLGKKPDS